MAKIMKTPKGRAGNKLCSKWLDSKWDVRNGYLVTYIQ